MQNATLLWQVTLVAPEGQRGMALGFVGLSRLVPIVLGAFWAGVLADAYDRRKLMLATQGGMLLAALGLAWVSLTGTATLANIYALSALGAQAFGVRASVVSGGILCVAVAAFMAWRTPVLHGHVARGRTAARTVEVQKAAA